VRPLTGSPAGLIDADVTNGSLDDLTGPGTIAVSSNAFMGVGDMAELRFGSTSLTATIVAVYERGLGFGDCIVLSSSLPASVQPTSSDLLLARGSGTFPSLSVSSVDDYMDATVAGAAAQQRLGAIPLFVLIFFVAIAAANTLVVLPRARSAEFALLRRIGGLLGGSSRR
jgi:putative ABC transport system permease protein